MGRIGRPPMLSPEVVLAYCELSVPEQAAALGVSVATVKRQWKKLRDTGTVTAGDPRLPRRGGARARTLR